jgi:LPXTG-motif cell wall-anchored protein
MFWLQGLTGHLQRPYLLKSRPRLCARNCTLDDTTNILTLIGILLATLLGLVGVYFLIRKMKNASQMEIQADFTLSDLRKLHADGHMTDEEFNAAKAKVVERATATQKSRQPAPK